MKYETPKGSFPSGLGQIRFINDVTFYQLSILTNDLALSECLYVDVQHGFEAELCPPNTISRLEIAKTPAKVLDDFLVPHGYVDRDYEDSPPTGTPGEAPDPESQASIAVLNEDRYTISFEWLENEIHSTLTDASHITSFHGSLDLLRNEIEDKVASGAPAMETLYVKSYDPKNPPRTYFISIGFA